jgi:hypothetical protein
LRSLFSNHHFAPHWNVIVSSIDKINSRRLWFQAIKVGVEGEMVQEVGYGTDEPATTSNLKPAEVTTE